jgi:hypothetical protein
MGCLLAPPSLLLGLAQRHKPLVHDKPDATATLAIVFAHDETGELIEHVVVIESFGSAATHLLPLRKGLWSLDHESEEG